MDKVAGGSPWSAPVPGRTMNPPHPGPPSPVPASTGLVPVGRRLGPASAPGAGVDEPVASRTSRPPYPATSRCRFPRYRRPGVGGCFHHEGHEDHEGRRGGEPVGHEGSAHADAPVAPPLRAPPRCPELARGRRGMASADGEWTEWPEWTRWPAGPHGARRAPAHTNPPPAERAPAQGPVTSRPPRMQSVSRLRCPEGAAQTSPG